MQFKPSSNIKSSERKRILNSVCDSYGLKTEELPSDAKNKIVPKDLRSCKVQLHSGETALLYTTEGEKPVWIKLREGHLVPTVFTLWEAPYILKKLYTPIYTIERLQNGADLMIPGVFDPLPENCPRGTVVAINTVQSPTVTMAVGVTLTAVSDITDDQTGKAAYIVNVVGDTLLEGYRGNKKVPTTLDTTLPNVNSSEVGSHNEEEDNNNEEETAEMGDTKDGQAPEEQGQDEAELTSEQLAELLLENEGEDDEEEEIEEPEKKPQPDTKKNEPIAQEQSQPQQEPSEGGENDSDNQPTFSTEEIDELLYKALLQVLKKAATETPIELPVPGSLFLSQHLLPNLAFQDSHVNIKTSSYKKAQKFFKAMEKKKLLKCRERNGETIVQSVAGTDTPEVGNFTIYKVKKSKGNGTGSGSKPKGEGKMVAREYWKPRSVSSPLFFEFKLNATQFYPTETLKEVLSKYVEKYSLGQGKQVKIDPLLAKVLSTSEATLSREQLLPNLQKNCTLNHTITLPGEDEPKRLSKGSIPKISIIVERRGGNKVVTRISNIEPFHLIPETLAEELRVHCAGATSVNHIREGSDAKEVMVQGPQQKAVIKLLEQKGVRSASWVEVNDKTAKKKKKIN